MSVSRRRLFGTSAAAVGVGLAAGVGGTLGAERLTAPEPDGPYALAGDHQPGIVTPAQDRLHFAAFDVTTTSREALVALLKAWTTAADEMMRGLPVSGLDGGYDAPPADTGEAEGLPHAHLTITIGFGPSLFRDAAGSDRFGIADRQPRALQPLPHFAADKLDPARSNGDLCVQACADDPQVAVHAIRNLARIGFGTVALRWSQLGYGRTSSTSTDQATPRNLFGFKDGTANVKAEESEALDEHIWVADDDDPAASWLAGGSYLVSRRIAMILETWDRTSLREQENLIGRDRAGGAPLSGGTEFTPVNFATTGREGKPLVPVDSHVAMAHPTRNGGVRMLRRGYNYIDGSDALGRMDAGLFFICFVRNPLTQYVPMQTKMSKSDALMEYLQHRASALFAVPPGIMAGEYVGQALFS
ncbi:iron uptake transporter deferrochelatase/peroxidase subunit [Aestuariimicrobium soli]|uniref:iron uptake transporter deferrochelatase/peroxidase subunit n=1 Tax=Aestuariimicrobium soli TaxID=2035834 RepID=UPI003EBC08AE